MAPSPRRIIKELKSSQEALIIPSRALKTVTSKSGNGVYASSDTLFKGAVFGRDSLDVADDLMKSHPKLVSNILLTMARLQGTTFNEVNEEEPGKIIHEYRNVVVDGKPIDENSLAIFRALAGKWGGDDREMAYYGSVDATPHFLRTLGSFSLRQGNGLLDRSITLRNGETSTVREASRKAAEWILGKLDSSKSGMIEYRRLNPRGIENQVWKDSAEFYVHENGEMANHESPISSIEVQGLAYDGLIAASRIHPDKADIYKHAAFNLRDLTIDKLWNEDKQYFSLGTDIDSKDDVRVIKTMTANPAALLDTGFFDELHVDERRKYLSGIITTVMSNDFLTDAGIRSRALSAGHLVNFWDYHGSYVSWPKETYDISKGMRRQGFPRLATQLDNRILNIYMKNREYPEFLYVDGRGRVLPSRPSTHTHGELMLVESTIKPERVQAWTVSAVISIINRRLNDGLKPFKIRNKSSDHTPNWQAELEARVMADIHHIKTYLNPFKLSARYPTYNYKLNKN